MIAALIVAATLATGAGPLVVDRAQAVSYALAHQPAVLGADARVAAVRTHLEQARALPNPTFGFQVSGFNPANQGSQQVQAMLTQTLELSDRRRWRLAVEQENVRQAELTLAISRRAAAAEAKKAYNQVVAATAAQALAETGARWAEQLAGMAAARVKHGEAAPVESLRAQAALAQARQDLLSARYDREVALRRLQVALGAPGPVDVAAGATGGPIALPPRDRLLARGLAERPELLQARSNEAQERSHEALLRASVLPSADMGLGVAPSSGIPGLAASLQVPVPVWYAQQGEIAESRALQAGLAYDRQAVEQAVRAQVDQGVGRVAVAASQIRLYDDQLVPAAARLLDVTRRRYQQGDATGFELLDVRRALREAQLAELRARLDYQDAVVDLETAIGGDLPAIP